MVNETYSSATSTETSIIAGTCTLKSLFSFTDGFKLEIPDYQRPYVWDVERVEELLSDLESFYQAGKKDAKYYLGSVLFHKKQDKYLDIIDGQQRITTILILDYVLNGNASVLYSKSAYLNLWYNSPKSQNNIHKNRDLIVRRVRRFLFTCRETILNDIVVSVIVTSTQDDAFTFFDTQNNRGISLSAVDFFKSFHLRELKGEEDKQRILASRWDSNNQSKFLDILFNQVVWRSRKWRGKKVFYETKEYLLDEFQKGTLPKSVDNRIEMYPGNKNRLAAFLSFNAANGISIYTSPIALKTNVIDYPFSIRQPIQRGEGFFLFTEKYAALYKYIFELNHPETSALGELMNFYNTVYSSISQYLKELFKLCVIMYYDRLDDYKIVEFALWLDYLIGSYRISQDSIVAQTPVRILRDATSNLLDVINSAYRPEEIFSFLDEITNETIYKEEKLGDGNGVKERYKKQVKQYYNTAQELTLALKKEWIHAKINSRKQPA